MSLQPLDELFKILKDERMIEMRAEIDRLRSVKTYGLYDETFGYTHELMEAIVCDENCIKELARQRIKSYYHRRHQFTQSIIFFEPNEFVIEFPYGSERYTIVFKAIEQSKIDCKQNYYNDAE